MKKDPWIAFTLGVTLHILSIPITLSMPETLNLRQCAQTTLPRRDSSSSHYRPTSPDKSKSARIARTVQNFSFALKQYLHMFHRDWRILVIVTVFVGLPFLLTSHQIATILTLVLYSLFVWPPSPSSSNFSSISPSASTSGYLRLRFFNRCKVSFRPWSYSSSYRFSPHGS